MTKVLYVITKGNWGGAQKYVFELATRLPKSEFEVCVACGEGEELPKRLQTAGIRVIRVPGLGRDVSLFKDLGAFRALRRLFKDERPDVVHLNSSKVGGIGALAARLSGVRKILFTVHGLPSNEPRPLPVRFLIALASWITFVLSTKVIVISRREYSQIARWPLVRRKLSLVYNGIPAPELLSRCEAREKLAALIGKPVELLVGGTLVGTIAELTPNKGLRYAIEAMKDLPDLAYVVLGGGELENELKKQARDTGLGERVFFAGFVPDASRFLSAFDIFLLPSLKEGMPYVLMEAGHAGLPIVTTHVGGIPEIVVERANGIMVPPADAGAIAQALRALAKDRATAAAYGAHIKEYVARHFAVDKSVRETQALYL